MKNNLTEIIFILDRSGSMGCLVEDTIGGFNAMINSQKAEPGDAFVTTVLFDDKYDLLHDRIDIQQIENITEKEYYARGMTALLDAVGKTINSIGTRLNSTREEQRPDKVLFVITTDGLENASREYNKTQIKEMIQHQQSKYNWTFMFLGANMDAVGEAASLGINTDFARNYTASSIGTQSVYASLSKAVSLSRGAELSNNSSSESYKAVMDSLNEVE